MLNVKKYKSKNYFEPFKFTVLYNIFQKISKHIIKFVHSDILNSLCCFIYLQLLAESQKEVDKLKRLHDQQSKERDLLEKQRLEAMSKTEVILVIFLSVNGFESR